jgi:hypothetical protein
VGYKPGDTAIGHLVSARTTLSVAYKVLRHIAGGLKRPC